MKLEFSKHIFEKFSYINFLKIRSVEAVFHADGRTQDEVNSRFSQFCERF